MNVDFKNLSEKDLLMAYEGYKLVEKTGAVGEDDFDGIFRRAIDERKELAGGGVFNAAAELKSVLAEKWFEEHKMLDEMLTPGTDLWYVDEEDGTIEHAVVATVDYKNGKLDSFSAEFPDTDDFDEFYGSALGSCFFRSEEAAKRAILEGKN